MCSARRRYNDLVVEGSMVPGNGTTALVGANDTVTQRYEQAVAAGMNIVRFFPSEGVAGALETAPGMRQFHRMDPNASSIAAVGIARLFSGDAQQDLCKRPQMRLG